MLACDIHSRERSKRLLKEAGAEIALNLSDIMTAPVNGSGYNENYGLYGSNKATEDTIKLFPRDCQPVVEGIAKNLREASGKLIEAMVYGDGAFKDPVGKIWELADPVVSPAYTAGLEGQPNELKLKYLADNDFAELSGDALKQVETAIDSLIIGVDVDREVRRERITRRLHARLEEGMVDEIRGLLSEGIKPEDLIYYGLEYKFITKYVIGELTYDEMVKGLEIAIHQFAKRQMTWFRGMERRGFKINWIKDEQALYNILS